jgi:hypothetical protein
MVNSIIAFLILLLNIVPLMLTTKRAKSVAYQWWHMPWLAFLFVVVAYYVFRQIDVTVWPVFRLLFDNAQVEAAYVLLCQAVWLLVGAALRRPAVHKVLLPWFQQLFGGQGEDRDHVLPFPYFIDHEKVVRSRVGKPFYQQLLGAVIVIIAVAYALFFLMVELVGISFWPLSAFGLFALLPLADYYHYLKAEVPEEKEQVGEGRGPAPAMGDLERLWALYTETFPSYAVAWKRKWHVDSSTAKDNQDIMEDLLEQLTTSTPAAQPGGLRGADGCLENCDLTDAFLRLEPLFNWEEENGRLMLLVLDIPNHFSQSTRFSFLQEIAAELKGILHKDLKVYDEYSPSAVLNSSIVVASLPVLSMRNLDEEWMRRIGLVMVVNLFDKSLSNLYACRKFSYLLRAANAQYQLLFLTPHLRGVDPAMKNVWLTGTKTVERLLRQHPHGHHQFFIGYDIEDYIARLECILKPLPGEPMSAGCELAPIALSCKEGDKPKTVTPVHFLDLAYTNIVEGIEELGKFYRNDYLPVRVADINRHIHSHLLPVGSVDEPQVFSVVFDQENNAPAAYSKWMHLGCDENMTVVVSRPYLLRDYFNANHDFFVNAPFLALQPHLSKSRVTLAVILLEMLQKSEMTEAQLRGLLQGYYSEDDMRSVSTVVQQLFATYFANDLAGSLQTVCRTVFDGSQYQDEVVYQLGFTDSVNLSYLDHVSVKDESGNVLFVIIKDLMNQNFAKKQIHSFLGKPYEIDNYDSANRVLKVKAANTQAKNVFFYKSVQCVTLGSRRRPIEEMAMHSTWSHFITGEELGLDFEGFETPVTVGVSRWYEFCHYTIPGATYTEASPAQERKYENGRVLKVSLRYLQKKEYLDRIDDIRKSLQVLLYEVMQSVFPHHAQYLIISTCGEGDADLPWIFNRFTCNDHDVPGTLSFYFTEDAHVDLGLIGALANKDNFGGDYLFRYIFDYLMWLTEGETVPAGGYDEYSTPERDKFRFLKYGRDALPAYFDVNLLINFIRDFFCEGNCNVLQGVTKRTQQQDVFGVCDFCRKKMKNSEMQRLSDGRMRCPDCSVDAVDTVEQFNKLCEQACYLFKQHLGIDFSRISYQAKLTSAVELHRVRGKPLPITNGYDARKLLGVAYGSDIFYVEDGRKPMETLGIIIHEMTHIWQFSDSQFASFRQDKNWVEGLAVWTDLFLMGKHGATNVEELREGWLTRNDEYGIGLRYIMSHCPDDPYAYLQHHPGESIPSA